MRRRVKMSRRGSKKVFKKYTGVHRHWANTPTLAMRGGVRM